MDLTRLNLLVPITVILEFFRRSGGLLWPLFLLFKKSLEEGQLPTAWKEAMVIPIFKKGSRTQPTNYRPVSLTSVAIDSGKSVDVVYLDFQKAFDHVPHNRNLDSGGNLFK